MNTIIRTGKEKCEYLRRLRQKIAERYSIEYHPMECNHIGDCIGTCPQCDKELRELTSLINKKNLSNISFNCNINEFVIE